MRKEHFVITDRSWAIIESLVPGTALGVGVTAKDTRLFLEAVLWRVRVGGPWRDLPPALVSGTASFGGSADGQKRAYLRGFLGLFQVTRILNIS